MCKILNKGVARKEMVDAIEHCIQSGRMYLTCNYLEKDEAKSTKKYVKYKQIPGTVYIYPEEVFYINIGITNTLVISII